MKTERRDYYLHTMGIDRWVLRETYEAEKKQGVNSCSDWQTLEATVKNCQLCALAKSRTQTVFGVGNKNAELMIVGEAPGFHEDKQGEPFVGRAGLLLNKMLEAVGFSREKVYIANVLKCRPPNNRDPLPEEVKLCTNYLAQQVKFISPQLIIAVGRFAAHYLLGTTASLSALRNHLHSFGEQKIPVIVSYHPAYLLRNPSDKSKAYRDWCWIVKYLRESS